MLKQECIFFYTTVLNAFLDHSAVVSFTQVAYEFYEYDTDYLPSTNSLPA